MNNELLLSNCILLNMVHLIKQTLIFVCFSNALVCAATRQSL